MKTRVAVVGSGFGLYGILPAFQQIPDVEIVGLCGKSSDRLLNYCRQTNVPVFSDWRVMLNQARPDAIAVAVIPVHQTEIISAALDRGLSVLAEKPLAVDLATASALLEKARVKKVAHMIDFLFPEIPEWRRTRELLAEGAIGPVQNFQLTWRFLSYDIKNRMQGWKTRPDEGGGALSFFFSHAFYNIEFFLGPIQSLHCELTRSPDSPGPGETGINLSVTMTSGATGTITFDCADPGAQSHDWQFQGSTGSLTLTKTTPSFTRGYQLSLQGKNGSPENLPVPPLPCDPSLDERVSLVKSVAGRFIHWHRHSNPAQPDFAAGLRVQHLIECARQSSTHQEIVTC